MKALMEVKSREEARLLRAGLSDPVTRAVVTTEPARKGPGEDRPMEASGVQGAREPGVLAPALEAVAAELDRYAGPFYAWRSSNPDLTSLIPSVALGTLAEKLRAHRCGGAQPLSTADYEAILDDMGALLRLLKLGDHARSASPHEVMVGEIIPAAEALLSSRCGGAALPEVLEKAVSALQLAQRRLEDIDAHAHWTRDPAQRQGTISSTLQRLQEAESALESYRPEPLPEAVAEVVKELRDDVAELERMKNKGLIGGDALLDVEHDSRWLISIADRLSSAVAPASQPEAPTPENDPHPWARFLEARRWAIEWLLGEGNSAESVAHTLSCDPGQVRLIHASTLERGASPASVAPPAAAPQEGACARALRELLHQVQQEGDEQMGEALRAAAVAARAALASTSAAEPATTSEPECRCGDCEATLGPQRPSVYPEPAAPEAQAGESKQHHTQCLQCSRPLSEARVGRGWRCDHCGLFFTAAQLSVYRPGEWAEQEERHREVNRRLREQSDEDSAWEESVAAPPVPAEGRTGEEAEDPSVESAARELVALLKGVALGGARDFWRRLFAGLALAGWRAHYGSEDPAAAAGAHADAVALLACVDLFSPPPITADPPGWGTGGGR